MPPAIARRSFLKMGAAAVAGSTVSAFPAGPGDVAPMAVIDTHLHLWDLKRLNLPWLTDAPKAINRTFGLDDFRAAAEGLNVVKTVYMEVDVHPAQQFQEAELAISLCKAEGSRVAGAVIGGYPQEKSFAEYLLRFAAEPAVKGVRTVLHGERPAGLCLQPGFVQSMKRLGDAKLTFDLCMRPGELFDGARLAAACPETTFVLDHCGNVGFRPQRDVRSVWCEGIKATAAQPNVVCKISGLISKAGGTDWIPAQIAENIDFCLDCFGEDRVLFGGDWPVCLLGGSYRKWVEAISLVTGGRSEGFRRKLFHDNAVRVYRLG
jgi:L-fuconolactonase